MSDARRFLFGLACAGFTACGATPTTTSTTSGAHIAGAPSTSASSTNDAPQTMHATKETDLVTPSGAKLVAPKGWFFTRHAGYLDLQDPDRALHVLVVELPAQDGVAAIDSAWKIVGETQPKVLSHRTPPNDKGWELYTSIHYEQPADGSHDAFAWALRGGGKSFVFLVHGKRSAKASRYAQIVGLFWGLRVEGVQPEDDSKKIAKPFAGAMVDDFAAFVEKARIAAKVPGGAVAVVQGGKVVWSKGFGVRTLGKTAPMTPDTRAMIGSETKSLTTLMMARLVDDAKVKWDEPVVALLPTFALADADVTKKLVLWNTACACTGVPRRDYEILLGPRPSPEALVASMKTMKQTTPLGEVFQYSNEMVALGGYAAAHAFAPKKSLGDAYESAMQTLIFTPMGMTSTTLSLDAIAKAKDVATGHAMTIDGDPIAIDLAAERDVLPIRPAGAIWSTANDMAKWLVTELARGVAPNGTRIASEANVTRRWQGQIEIDDTSSYGLGLIASAYHGIRVVSHGGATAGFSSDALWMPDKGVGIVVLTNGNYSIGGPIRSAVSRRLFELLFDAKPDADARLAYALESHADDVAKERARIEENFPGDWMTTFGGTYENAELGKIRIYAKDGAPRLDGGEWNARIAPKTAEDGTKMVTTVEPPYVGEEFFARIEDGAPVIVFETPQEKFVFHRAK
jgi:CubicO group peptidase (beta-lactamase class C family)